MKKKIAIVRGAFLNKYEMQSFEPLTKKYDLTAFGSKVPFHSHYKFPVKQLCSPMDLPNFPYKMQLLNRLFVDAHYLIGLENSLKGFSIAHSAETYYHYTQQCLNAKQKGRVKKVVVTVLENISFNNEGIWGRKNFKERTREEADKLIALTQKTKDTLIQEGAESSKIIVIGSGIDTTRFVLSKRIEKDFVKNNKEITLLFVGRLETYKGIYDLLKAFAMLLKDKDLEKYYLKLLVVGKGNEESNIKNLEKILGIANNVEHTLINYELIHAVYQRADIFIAPSTDTKTWQEQYGYMLLEAQATGLPIITTYSGSIPEVVGDGALLVKQHAVDEIYTSIKKLIENPDLRLELSQKARKRAIAFHDISKKAMQLENLYESLL